ncbi:ornithine carbamoyltransferase [Anatilimnocola floriformis]|uniref:ornithine carbamoyltransferase n=1 Tax=Anatilimnocola floriformis TaxID=2948575 RepID=UPI0020C401E8|nr:ornithine carbamoyltransferase [Anatilimnocola floriformis]
MKRHVLTLFELTAEEIHEVFALSHELKRDLAAGIREPILPGRVMAMLFEKQSLRTRVSFETAMAHLGGSTLFLGQDVGWGKRESAADFSQVLSSYVDVVVCRTTAHSRIEELAQYCTCPVINGLTDSAHPCQALADLFTLEEIHGKLEGKKLAFIGDSNNVAKSLAVCCAKLGMEFAVASPSGYTFDKPFLAELEREVPGAKLTQTAKPREAVRDAIGVYTDVWTSMGQEAESEQRKIAFKDYQVDVALMEGAPEGAVFLHCLPAKRGEEVTADVIDGHYSAVIPQAANRMHVQKGLIAWLLGERP